MTLRRRDRPEQLAVSSDSGEWWLEMRERFVNPDFDAVEKFIKAPLPNGGRDFCSEPKLGGRRKVPGRKLGQEEAVAEIDWVLSRGRKREGQGLPQSGGCPSPATDRRALELWGSPLGLLERGDPIRRPPCFLGLRTRMRNSKREERIAFPRSFRGQGSIEIEWFLAPLARAA